MPNPTNFRPFFVLVPALVLAMLASNAFALNVCYSVSNFAVPNYVNITLNGTKFMMRLNFLGPDSAGITINESKSYGLLLNQSQTIAKNRNYTYFSELVNVSWLPVEHTAVVMLCSALNQSASSTTTSSSTTSSTTSVSTTTTVATTTTLPQTSASTTMPQQPPARKDNTGLIAGVVALIVVAVLAGALLARKRKM
jgi:hypothetical protein